MLGTIQILALILIVVSFVKLIILLINPKSWINFAGWVYGGRYLSAFILLVLSGIVFYYLIKEISVVQILAVTLFVSLFIGAAYALIDGKNFIKSFYKSKMKNLLGNGIWFYTLIWLALMIWGLVEIF